MLSDVTIYEITDFEAEIVNALRKRGIDAKHYAGSITIHYDKDSKIRGVEVRDIRD